MHGGEYPMKSNLWKLMCLLIVLALFIPPCGTTAITAPATVAPATAVPETTTCTDADRVPITGSTIAGFYTYAMTSIVKDFEAENCVKVTIVGIDNAQLYDKQIIEAVGETGAYDVYNIENAEKAGFAESGYILPMDEYIAANPDKVAYDDIAPVLADITTKDKGHIWGLPYS